MKPNLRNASRFRRLLHSWARSNLREYPWRREQDRFRLLLSEMMLRRTRADQVVPVYERVAKRYPTAEKLATASAKELRELLYPLRLTWRADNTVSMVCEVVKRYGGEVPGTKAERMSLPGVGDYVASAVTCFSDDEPTPIIDTNVVRVIGRILGLRLDGEARRRKEMRDAATLCLDQRQPRLYNYALLDFAALVCTASAPRCSECPFGQSDLCEDARRRPQRKR
jgi:A/G-specific adenine glycosylase